MTHLGNRTVKLTKAEFDALPQYHSTGRVDVVGATFRSVGGTGKPMVVELVKQPPMFDLEPVWYHTEVV